MSRFKRNGSNRFAALTFVKYAFPHYITILTVILCSTTPVLANNVTDCRDQVTGQTSPMAGIDSSIEGQGQAAPIEVTYLNESNVLGSTGYEHWDILNPGTYVLTYTPAVISTRNNYAIRILASNVIFDGNGKTITGPGIGTIENGDSYYGIRVNSGALTQNVTVKNVTAMNKFFGVIYEYVQGGSIRDSQFVSNGTGIYAWKSSGLSILSNTVHSNTHDGIVLDAHQSTNDYFTIDSNNVYNNTSFGILLWLSNNHNTITNNQANDNNMGLVLTDGGTGVGGTDNTLSNNTVNGNVAGIFLSNYHSNRVTGNSLTANSNVAVWLEASSNNLFTGNYVRNSGWVGIDLTNSSNGNVLYNNYFRNIDNEFSDGTVFNNQWYQTPTTGANIIGGPSISGNYWSNPSSSGFSDTCPDGNNDGFCDGAYNPQGDLVDGYPLHGAGLVGGPDLTGTLASLTQRCKGTGATQNCQLRGMIQVRNQGNQKASTASFLRFHLSADNILDAGDTVLQSVTIRAVRAGMAQRGRLSYRLPTGYTASGQYVLAVLDATGLIVEQDETNNVLVFGPVP